MRARLAILGVILLPLSAAADPRGTVVGDVRVEALSSTLVRLEVRGPKGFEDRKTFHVVDRNFPGLHLDRKESGGQVTLDAGIYKILLQKSTDLAGVKIEDNKGAVIWEYKGLPDNRAWLPAPSEKPQSWGLADTPRLVPSRWGLAPAQTLSPKDPLYATSGWDTGNDAPDVYVFLPAGDPKQLRKDLLQLTGPVEMPPLFMLGFIDSRYFAYHEDDALARIREYRRRGIPLDTFVVDTDWRLGGSHGYTPDPQYFPDLPRFLKAAHDEHVKLMFNDHPEPASKEALDPAELKRRADGLGGLLAQGVDVWWYDRNWPVGLVPPAPNLDREVWGMKLYHDITLGARPNSRPVIMANVDGIDNGERKRPPNVTAHRYPVQWTGDTSAHWEFLQHGIENAVHEGVLGLNAWVNEDLGGHLGTPTPDLYIRYLEFGSVAPVMRVHCTKGETREPWAFGPEAEMIVPRYIKMRYRLMPLLYASARQAFEEGLPILRRCDFFYPYEPEAARETQFLLGDSLLVAPAATEDGRREVWIPPGTWIDAWSGEELKGPAVRQVVAKLDQMPMFVRAGGIIPLAPEMQYTGERPLDSISLDAYAGDDGETTLYEDDGSSNGYLKSEFRKTRIEFETRRPQGTPIEHFEVRIPGAEGSFKGALQNRSWTLRIHIGDWTSVDQVSVDGKVSKNWKVIRPFASSMPFANSGPAPAGDVVEVVLPSGPVSKGHVVTVEANVRK